MNENTIYYYFSKAVSDLGESNPHTKAIEAISVLRYSGQLDPFHAGLLAKSTYEAGLQEQIDKEMEEEYFASLEDRGEMADMDFSMAGCYNFDC